jgi:hypothetical protein
MSKKAPPAPKNINNINVEQKSIPTPPKRE